MIDKDVELDDTNQTPGPTQKTIQHNDRANGTISPVGASSRSLIELPQEALDLKIHRHTPIPPLVSRSCPVSTVYAKVPTFPMKKQQHKISGETLPPKESE